MLKLKMIINALLAVTILFFYHSIDPFTAHGFDYSRGNENVIVDQCPREDSRQGDGGVSTLSGNQTYTSNWSCTVDPNFKYDTVNSQKTIARNSSAALVVIGNNGPYTWSVSGTGFSLESEGEPTGSTNTLYADGSACGSATITVTGCGGTQVEGYVRCTDAGKWVLAYNCHYANTTCRLGKDEGKYLVSELYYSYTPYDELGCDDYFPNVGDCGGSLSPDDPDVTVSSGCNYPINVFCMCTDITILEWQCP